MAIAANLVRAAILTGYSEVARSLGLDAPGLLKATGLHRFDLADLDTIIPANAVAELLERSAAKAGVEDFGLRMVARRSLAHLGPIGLIARDEPTVRHLFQSLDRHFRLRTQTVLLHLEEGDDIASLRVQLILRTKGSIRQLVELCTGITFRTIKELAGDAWAPECIAFSHPRPAGRSVHTSFFKTRVVFDSDFDGIVMPVRSLAAPIPNADPLMGQFVRRHLETVAGPAVSIDGVVRQLIFALLPSGRCTSGLVARQLGVDRRTLSRRLAALGATFSDIANEVRIELAARHIRTERKTLTETAQLLGFADLPSFSRWFHRNFGTNASHWRKAKAATSAPALRPRAAQASVRLRGSFPAGPVPRRRAR